MEGAAMPADGSQGHGGLVACLVEQGGGGLENLGP